MTTKTTIRVYTAAGTSASEIGEAHGMNEGCSWRNAVDQCDSDGGGRVFIDCDDEVNAVWVCEQLYGDDRVTQYDVI